MDAPFVMIFINVFEYQWDIYYDYNQSAIIYTRVSDEQDDETLSPFNQQINDVFINNMEEYTSDHHILHNESLPPISKLIIFSSIFLFLMVLITATIRAIMCCYKILHKYVTNKPSLYIFWYSILIDVFIFFFILHWFIEVVSFNKLSNGYCKSKYVLY